MYSVEKYMGICTRLNGVTRYNLIIYTSGVIPFYNSIHN